MSNDFWDIWNCPHCNNAGAVEQVAKHEIEAQGPRPRGRIRIEWSLDFCRVCRNVSLWRTETTEEGDLDCETLYPAAWVARFGAVPLRIRDEYAKALAVRRESPNAFAVLLGRVLDLTCADRGAQGSSLFARLEDLAQRGEIPVQIAETAHRLRRLRNIGAHADLGELSADAVPIVADLCEAVLAYVYTLPALLAQADQKLQALPQKK